jgi:hypothetical protein
MCLYSKKEGFVSYRLVFIKETKKPEESRRGRLIL